MGVRLPLRSPHLVSVFIPFYLAPSLASLHRCPDSLSKPLSFQKHRQDSYSKSQAFHASTSSTAMQSFYSSSSQMHSAQVKDSIPSNPSDMLVEFDYEASSRSQSRLSEKFDKLECLANRLQSQNLMTSERYSLLLNISFQYVRHHLNSSVNTNVDTTMHSRIAPIFEAWKTCLQHESPYPKPRNLSNNELYNIVTWSLLRRQLGINPQEPLPCTDIHMYIKQFLCNPLYPITPPQRDLAYHDLISSLLLSIDWTQFFDDLNLLYSRQRPPLKCPNSPLFPNEYPSRLSLAIHLRQECVERQREQGQGSTESQEKHLNNLISQSLELYSDCIIKVRRNLKLRIHESMETFSEHISFREIRTAALSIIESNDATLHLDTANTLFKTAIKCSDFDLAKTLYLHIRDPPVHIGSHLHDNGSLRSLFEHAKKLGTFCWDFSYVTQFEMLFRRFHMKDPRFALMLYTDWCSSSSPPRFLPNNLWPLLFSSVSSRNDTILLKHVLDIYQSQKNRTNNDKEKKETEILPPDYIEEILSRFLRTHSVVPLLRALVILENFIAPHQTIPLHLYDLALTHLSKSYQERTNNMLEILSRLPHTPKTSTLNPILASIVRRFRTLDETSSQHLIHIWGLYATSNANPNACTFSCMVFGLTRLGRLDEAYEMWLKAMNRQHAIHVRPNVIAFLIEKYATDGRVDRALDIGKQWLDDCSYYYELSKTSNNDVVMTGERDGYVEEDKNDVYSDESTTELEVEKEFSTELSLDSDSTDWIDVINTSIAYARRNGMARYLVDHDVWVIGRDILRSPV